MITLATGETIRGVAGTATAITYTIDGMELNGTTETYKVLSQGQLPAAAATIYTVPGSNIALVKTIILANATGSSVSGVILYINGTAASNQITGSITIPAHYTLVFNQDGWRMIDDSGAVVSVSTVTIHGIADNTKHSSAATPGQMLKADANGLPVNATNTDASVSAAVTASHARSHAITSTSDHTSSATSGKMLKADANGLPAEATNTDSDVADAVSKKHAQNTDTGTSSANFSINGTNAMKVGDAPTSHKASHVTGGGDIIDNATTTATGHAPVASAPAASQVAAPVILNAETTYTCRAITDATNPANLGTAAPGTATTVAHRDHIHDMPALDAVDAPTDITTLNATTSAHGLVVKPVAPAANQVSAPRILNGETAYTCATLTDTTNPADCGTAAPGTSTTMAHRDHVHNTPVDSTAIHKATAAEISAMTEKVTLVGADVFVIEDSAAAYAKKKVQVTNLPGGVDTTAVHKATAAEISAMTEKTSLVGADVFVIEDSAAAFAKKKVQVTNLPGGTDTTAIHKATASEISAMTEKATSTGADMAVIEDAAAGNAKKMVYLAKIPARVGINVKSYGATGDSSTDDTAAIQAAITAALALGVGGRGVEVFFPAGVYKTSSALAVVGNNVDLVGAGVGATALYPQHTTGDVLQFGNGSTSTNVCGLRHMSLICASARTAGNTINVNLAHDITIQDFNISNYFVGILVQGASLKCRIDQGLINAGHVADGIGIKVLNGAGGDTYISNLVMSNTPASKPLHGIELTQTGHTSIFRCNVTSFVNGLTIDPQSSNDVTYLFCDHSLFDSCGSNALYFNPAAAASARARSMVFSNTWFSGTTDATSYGIYIGGGAASIIDDISFIGCRILNNQRDGVKWVYASAVNINFSACTIAGNSQVSSGTYSGIDIAANCSDFAIENCKIGMAGTATNTQLCAIKIAAGTSGTFRIIGNDISNNVTPPYLNFGALTGLAQHIQGNYPDVKGNCAVYTLPGTAATSGTGETLLFKATLPANAVRIGQYFRVRMVGASSSTGTLIFRVRVGALGTTGDAQAWISTTSAAQVANAHAGFDVYICVRSLTSVQADGNAHAGAVMLPTLIGAPATAAIVASATWYIDVLATCSTGTFTAQVGSIEAL